MPYIGFLDKCHTTALQRFGFLELEGGGGKRRLQSVINFDRTLKSRRRSRAAMLDVFFFPPERQAMKHSTVTSMLKPFRFIIYSCMYSVLLVEGFIFKDRIKELEMNKRLEDRIFLTLRLVSLGDCFSECERRPRCGSINYQRLSQTCELNNRNSSYSPEPMPRNGFVFLENGAWSVCLVFFLLLSPASWGHCAQSEVQGHYRPQNVTHW